MHQVKNLVLRLSILAGLTIAGLAVNSAASADCAGTNTCYGVGAMEVNPGALTGGNSAFGYRALNFNTTGGANTAAGADALWNNIDGYGNTAVGNSALNRNTIGSGNTAVGFLALFHNLNGENTAIGRQALSQNTSGAYNSALGGYALVQNTTGERNTGIGYSALLSNTTGNNNTASGDSALYFNTGNNNTASGATTLYSNTTGNDNTASGTAALRFNTTGNYNTAFGFSTLQSNTTGFRNVALGYQAGFAITTGSDNVIIGGGNQGNATDTGVIRIGASAYQKKTFIAGIRDVQTGLSPVKTVFIDANGQLGTIKSSRRFKEDIQPMGSVSERLFSLRPVTFRYKQPDEDGGKPLQFGLIAEEVAEAFPELATFDENGEPDSVSYQLLATLLLNEFQKEHNVTLGQANRIAELEKQSVELAALKKQVAMMAEVIDRLDHAQMVAATR